MKPEAPRRNPFYEKAGEHGLESGAGESRIAQAKPVLQDGSGPSSAFLLEELTDEQITRVLEILEGPAEPPPVTTLKQPEELSLETTLAQPEEPPLETTADLAAGSGGASGYSADFGTLVAGLKTGAGGATVAETTLPERIFDAPILADAEAVLLPSGVHSPLAATGPLPPASGSGSEEAAGGKDFPGKGKSFAAGNNSIFASNDKGNSDNGGNADPLFTPQADIVDFNDISASDVLDGTQYDALGGDDLVILPADAGAAAKAGFTSGQLFLANSGNDTVIGGSLPDHIDGGSGRDRLYGAAGNDTLLGGNGNDTLAGGPGDDELTGGPGKDEFHYSLAADEGNDTITDFETGKNGDKLVFSDLLDVNRDSAVNIAALDAGGHSVTGTANSIAITFSNGSGITLAGLDGSAVNSFADLLDMKVNIDFA
jgi:Ca2+-binding RTX toxin-like protein